MGIRIRNVNKVIKDLQDWKFPESEKKHIYKFAEEFRAGRITGRIGKDVEGSIESVLYLLKLPLEYFNKDVTKLIEEDIKKFFDSLMNDKLKKKIRRKVDGKLKWMSNGNYKPKGKKKFIRALLLYLKFRLENQPEKIAKFQKILKVVITTVDKEPQSLTDEEYKRLYEFSSEDWQRFFHEVNVWGGFRAGEFHQLVLNDFELPDLSKGENFVRINIRNATTKTKGRLVTLYGKNCYGAVKTYLDKRKKQGLRIDEPVFEKSYNATKIWIRRFSRKVLGKQIHHHLYRSTCATWLVKKRILTERNKLCMFFGWKFSSPMPDTYLNRDDITFNDIDERVKNTELEELRDNLEKESYEKNLEIEQQNKEIAELKNEMAKITAVIGRFKGKK